MNVEERQRDRDDIEIEIRRKERKRGGKGRGKEASDRKYEVMDHGSENRLLSVHRAS